MAAKDLEGYGKQVQVVGSDGTNAVIAGVMQVSVLTTVAPTVAQGTAAAASGAWPVYLVPATTAGWSVYRNLDLGVTGQVAKASAGQFGGGVICNRSASERFLKIYNKATAPTQADTPIFTISLPPGPATGLPSWMTGVAFSAGISVRATTGLADNDTGAPTANDVVVNLLYA